LNWWVLLLPGVLYRWKFCFVFFSSSCALLDILSGLNAFFFRRKVRLFKSVCRSRLTSSSHIVRTQTKHRICFNRLKQGFTSTTSSTGVYYNAMPCTTVPLPPSSQFAPRNGMYLYSSSYSFPIHPITLPSLPTTPSAPANHSATTAADTALMPYHLLFLTNDFCSSCDDTCEGAKPIHFAAPHTTCHAPTLTSAVNPIVEITGCSANPCEIYDRLINELSPCAYNGKILVVHT
jgi:hypothetical protein